MPSFQLSDCVPICCSMNIVGEPVSLVFLGNYSELSIIITVS